MTKTSVDTGTPPFSVSVSNAVCGPQVPGTMKPISGTSDIWASLNPCPLNVCCNVWGMCNITDDFRIIDSADTGAPGTTQPKKILSQSLTSGISNCGGDIIKGSAPAETMRVTYFQSWNEGRPCLHMDVNQIDTSKYTHIHFTFANITSAFDIDVSGAQAQFDDFKALGDVKRIITFGGWDFSTAPGTYNILREATKAANRAKFESNIVAFIKAHNLDGVDIDWEYTGAPGIPDIPAGDADAGEDLRHTLMGLKSTFSTSKPVSLTTLASYWYLKAFSVNEIGAKINCIDYGNQWTSPGCTTGNFLRSHVNLMETKTPSVVGMASYGRSFKMATARFSGPDCQFTGSLGVSKGAKDRCTAYIGPFIKRSQETLCASYNFAGTSEWAVDLEEFVDGLGDNDSYYVAKIDENYYMECNGHAALAKYDNLIQGSYDKKFKETGRRQCCSSCYYDACTKDCDKSSGCKSGFSSWDVTCPTVYANGALGIDYFNIHVPNIKFGNTRIKFHNGCQYAGEDAKACMMKYDDWFWNYPGPANDIKMFNPKVIVETSHGNFTELLGRLQLIMAEEAKDIEELERQELIASFLGALVAVRTGLSVAETAMQAFTIVQNPENAFESVFNTLAGAGLSRNLLTKAANERRRLGEEDSKRLGHDP
ncbi:glycoside hydrolase superfamily [Xylariaceae sp. FL1651]|nr:glycoside hydrolase superfamily [Xylariaceae sp. FL1651]